MTGIFSAVLPAIIVFVAIAGLVKKVDLFSALTDGAKDGLSATVNIIPSLVILFVAIHMFRASGAMDLLVHVLTPVASFVGIPSECLPLAMVRPLSGSGALAVGADIIKAVAPDSIAGRTAAVMLGSTETTFYTIAVYFGAAGVKQTRHAIPAALVADLAGFITAALAVRLFF